MWKNRAIIITLIFCAYHFYPSSATCAEGVSVILEVLNVSLVFLDTFSMMMKLVNRAPFTEQNVLVVIVIFVKLVLMDII